MNKIIYRIAGLFIIIWGISIWVHPIQHKYDVVVDFSEIKEIVSIGLIIYGGIFIWTTYRRKNKKLKESPIKASESRGAIHKKRKNSEGK